MVSEGNSSTTVIVGAGPAGIAAATELVERGANVTLIDESAMVGGHFFRQFSAAPSIARSVELDERNEAGKQLADRLDHDQLTILTDTLVWGLFDDNELAIYSDGVTGILRPEKIIIATGAIERVAAFPGWTLPGVITAGGLQSLVTQDGILPGERFLVAGTGPLLLATALDIAEAGGQVVAIVEGSSVSAPLRNVHRYLRPMGQEQEDWGYQEALRQHGIPVISSSAVTSVEGSERVQRAAVHEIDVDWCPVADTETVYSVDTVCINYGFEAATELARMIDCRIEHDTSRGGWFVAHDDMMRSTCPNVYVAGQATGIGGLDLAQATGRLAGLAVAVDLELDNMVDLERDIVDARAAVSQSLSNARVLNRAYQPAPGIASIVRPESTICRCEGILASDIDESISKDATTLNDVKRYTRCGMGACQGRICSPLVTQYLEHKTGLSPMETGQITARPPVKPVPLRALARLIHS